MNHAPAAYAKAFIDAQKGKLDREKEVLLDRLIAMMRHNGDEKKLPSTLRAILRLLSRTSDQQAVRVVTSVAMNAQEKSNFEKQFPAHVYTWEVNQAILGGMVIEQGTRLYQMSLRNLLRGLEH